MKVGDLVKCGHCKWVHFIVEDGEGYDNCFFCSCRAGFMLSVSAGDEPVGSTLQPINIRNCRGKPDVGEKQGSQISTACERTRLSSGDREEGWPAEDVELARAVYQDQRNKQI